MNYIKKSFTVSAPASKIYADNWERTFRTPAIPELEVHFTDEQWGDTLCPTCKCLKGDGPFCSNSFHVDVDDAGLPRTP